MDVSLIWAMATNRVIGKDNSLPWRLPKDMQHFMRSTMGGTLIMGRKTFESMKSPLPGRTSIVLTSNGHWSREGAIAVSDFSSALDAARKQARADGQHEVFVIGGSSVYAESIPFATHLYLTQVKAEVAGDVHFPELDLKEWAELEREDHDSDDRHAYAFSISKYQRLV